MANVLFVGGREGALRAAERMGHTVLSLSDRRPRRDAVAGFSRVDLKGPAAALVAAAHQLVGRRRVAAVVALTEAAVVPAAHVRAALGLAGMDVDTATQCHDKLVMKRAVRARGIRCADFVPIEARTRARDLVERLGLPIVVKPRRSSGSRGTFVAHTHRALRGALEPGLLAERFVRGVEMSVESFVVDGRIVFRNATDYHVPFWVNVLPSALDRETLRGVDELNRAAVAALGIERGITHLELFLTPRGPVFGEIAVRPPGGHLMELLERAYGFDPWQAALEIELGGSPDLPRRARKHAGAWVLHPGAGVVAHVRGVAAARRAEHVDLVACRVRCGDEVTPRLGSGNQVGHIVASAPRRADVVAALRAARELVRVELEGGGGRAGSAAGPLLQAVSVRPDRRGRPTAM